MTNTTNNSVKFIDYTGDYPCLCMGTLTLEINGQEYRFGHREERDQFWHTGGSIGFDEDWNEIIIFGAWSFNIPAEFKDYAEEIAEVFNANVPHGCCGGCI